MGFAQAQARLARIAERQDSLFTREEALRAGFTPRAIQWRCRSGVWIQIEQDVMIVAGVPITWRRRCMAATLRHPAAALSHQTSAVHLRLDGYAPGRPHIVVPPTANHTSSIATVHRSRHTQFTVVEGIRCTSFAQTMVQLAERSSTNQLRSALHSGVHADWRRVEQLHERIGELRDRRMPGMRRLVTLLDELDGQPPTASELERELFDTLLAVPDMPPVARQVELPWRTDGGSMFVDALVPDWRLILEADGRAWHSRIEDFERDRWRDAEALARGYAVMRFTWHRLRGDREGVVDQVHRFGQHRRAA